MSKTDELLEKSGIVGEQVNRQILWLVYSSRKRPKPLHVICLGASGTGKPTARHGVPFYPRVLKSSPLWPAQKTPFTT